MSAVLLTLRDRAVDLSGQLLTGGGIVVNRIDNGFLVRCVTTPLPLTGMSITTERTFFCTTVDELARTVATLMQMPWRVDEHLREGGSDAR